MLVNDVYKFTFVHIMKTGGNSMIRYLSGIPDTYQFNPKHGINRHGHDSIGNMPEKYLDGYFKFATLRDPRSWYMSLYYRAKEATGGNEEALFGDIRSLSLDEWVERCCNPKEWMVKNDVWTSDIADWIDRDMIINSKLDVGWFTFRNLFQLSSQYENVFKNFDNDELRERFNEILGVDCLLKQEHLDGTVRGVLLANTRIPEVETKHSLVVANKTARNYGRNIDQHYSPELSSLVKAKDFIWFENQYAENEGQVWYNE